MISLTQQPGRHFHESARLLLKLHHLMTMGEDESDEAEAVRDAMDYPWYQLNEYETRLLRGLSADLYTVGEDRPRPTSAPGSRELERFRNVIRDEDWSQALDIVRKNETKLDADIVAFMRGVCWAHLKEPSIAVEFFKEVERLRPLNDDELIWLMTSLALAHQTRDAMPYVKEIEERSRNPLLLWKAAEVLSIHALEIDDDVDDSVAIRRRAVDLAERALHGVADSSLERQSLLDNFRINGLLHLAMNYDELGHREAALAKCRKVLDLDPGNVSALQLLGWLNCERGPTLQQQDFPARFHRDLATDLNRTVSPLPTVGSST